jgi:hypothetical protein
MNKQIQELVERAGGSIGTGLEYAVVFGETQDVEKFVELIVRECVSIVAKRKDQAIDDGWNIDEAMSMAEMDLEEHFGVEE